MPLSQAQRDLVDMGDKLHSQRTGLLSLLQEIADNFYPQMADFTASRNLGETYADNLTSSFPLLVCRDLANAFSSMLRPLGKEWFHVTTRKADQLPEDARAYLEWATRTMRTAMYATPANFIRSTDEGDNSFAAFGQAVLSVELNRTRDDFLYDSHHLRDVAWCENAGRKIDHVDKKCKFSASKLVELFPGKVHPKVLEAAGKDKDKLKEFNCRHILVPSRYFTDKKGVKPYVSLYVDQDNDHAMEETELFHFKYIIPRWKTLPGSQYAYSPATWYALPDARLLQEMTLTLLNAGQMAVHPPLVATKEAIKGDVPYYAGGVIWADREYDERAGEAIRALDLGVKNGMPLGLEMAQAVMHTLSEAFFLNKLNMPQRGPEMTAYEVGQRVQEYIRNALPLFGPMEIDYNGQLCERTFELGMRAGLFGSPFDIPESLKGQDIQFRFESPLHDALDADKGQRFMEAEAVLTRAAALGDPLALQLMKVTDAARDTLHSIKVPSKWLRTEQEMDDLRVAEAERQKVEALKAQVADGAAIATMVGEAGAAMKEAQAPAMAA